MKKQKILAIKFKYLGDVAIAIPSFYALRKKFPQAELHVLIAEDALPIVKHLSWIDKIWSFPRKRGKISIKKSLPIVKQLRKEKFDRSVDLVGNDRGAILSLLIGAKRKLGVLAPKGFLGRRFCYTETIEEADLTKHETVRDLMVLEKWKVPCPPNPQIEIVPDLQLKNQAQQILGKHTVIAHLSTSRPKKEWSLENWVQLYSMAKKKGISVLFSSGPSAREQELLEKLQKHSSSIPVLGKIDSLDLFMAIIAKSQCFISPDTAPLHIAAGMGVPTIGLFGATASTRWAPLGKKNIALQGDICPCSGHAHSCQFERRCMDTIEPEIVFQKVLEILKI